MTRLWTLAPALSLLLSGFLALAAQGAAAPAPPGPLAWPPVTNEMRPWARWWWLGSAVDKANLTSLLQQYHGAGLGGVEICPIYGARGYEDRFIPFLSPRWMEMLAHTTTGAKRVGLGVDLTTGTGWPFGGPSVTAEDASSRVVLKRCDVAGGTRFLAALPSGRLRCLMAVSETGERVDLTDRPRDWTAPAGKWKVYAVVESGPVQKVKRAAPGGEGNVVDPYSTAALDRYLGGFDRAFAGYHAPPPRSHFHDSFEYYGATWTPALFSEFRKRRGYDLRAELLALFGEGPEDTVARVKADYRETVSDLHLEYVRRWTAWCHGHGSLSRNQAHGAPGNLIDLYAAADIPETEIFAAYDESHLPMLKLSSSAAHLTGGKLASSESFTWLAEHFQAPLSEVKPAADFFFLSGVNHLFFHGIPYSPDYAGWPGWLFYAAVNFGPNGGLWHDLPAFNAYAARCQSVLQQGRPANDVLLYVPFQDLWHDPNGLLTQFTTPGKWMVGQPFYEAALALADRGYGYDEISDRLLADTRVAGGAITAGGSAYRVVVLPKVRRMQPATLRKLVELARGGATILVQGALPADVPGLGELEKRRAELRELLAGIRFDGAEPIREARIGSGRFLLGSDLDRLLDRAGVKREAMVDSGLRFIRRTHEGGLHYFIVNRGHQAVDAWAPLGTTVKSAVLLDPRFDDRAGVAAVRQASGGAEVYLQLQPGESCILRTFTGRDVRGRAWSYEEPDGEPAALSGTWKVRFIEGGPALPAPYETSGLASWTDRLDPEAKRFAGTARYTLEFTHPGGKADDWVLDLGRVAESARVTVNGKSAGTLWSAPFRVPIGSLLRRGRNTLDVEVTNLAANRIADLDRRGVPWKAFHEINFVNRAYKPFDASTWPPRDSGLLGPVRLLPARRLRSLK